MVATAQRSAEENQLQVTESTRLSDLVRSAQANAEKVSADRDELAAQLDSLQQDAARSDAGVAAALGDIKNISTDAGLTEMTGPGVVVTMTDAPRNADGKYPVDATPDDLVVHQQDVQSVLNALWAGGAEAVGMQDQRIISTSAPRCIGNTLLLHGRTYSPPYVMSAIGDVARLEAALAAEPGIRIYKQYATRFGLGYTQATPSQITVPAYTGG
ncbi:MULTISPECIES: DUF881 domain-containing protein [unclassified Rhodococcus (in: high G+C Gram-positive bacteria)]|uniref:DUF881 domain-containing protein n=2 Tax=unclassified Rhodococcus (in: high G+C Gram-positive bacteria) TaxID=192944 RepID=UPI00211A1FAC|nr:MULTISPECIES: DUF881 domain-containing protein [unclassified Rhodococcus (in: high G+C Gram-positive bacteria)]MCX6474079.1 DUF881 domain-containing protein [Rhodococcus sp. (in: high G+C Gram-positive bacteria)]